MLVHSTASWLPNQMISLVLIFGFLCRSSIFRYPDNLRNVRVSPVTAANTGSGYGAPAGTGKVDERISNQGDLSTGPSAAYPSLSGLYVCICLCVFVFVSQQGHQQSTHPHRWKTPICQSPPSPLTRREAAHTESRNITLNMNSLSLSSKRLAKITFMIEFAFDSMSMTISKSLRNIEHWNKALLQLKTP